MKIYFLILLFFFSLAHSALGQTSEFPEIGSEWTKAWYGMTGLNSLSPNSEVVTGDTLINGSTYFIVENGFFRDSLDIWYCIKAGETEEHLFFDFNLELGDTMYFYNPFLEINPEITLAEYLVVNNVEEVTLLNGSTAKNMHLHYSFVEEDGEIYYGAYENWITGVGSIHNMFDLGRVQHFADGGYPELVCFNDSEEGLLYEDPVPDVANWGFVDIIYEDCNWWVGIEEINPLESGFSIKTNPVDDILTLEVAPAVDYLIITDLYGKTIMDSQKEAPTSCWDSNSYRRIESFNVNSLPSGFYLVSWTNNGQAIQTESFIKK